MDRCVRREKKQIEFGVRFSKRYIQCIRYAQSHTHTLSTFHGLRSTPPRKTRRQHDPFWRLQPPHRQSLKNGGRCIERPHYVPICPRLECHQFRSLSGLSLLVRLLFWGYLKQSETKHMMRHCIQEQKIGKSNADTYTFGDQDLAKELWLRLRCQRCQFVEGERNWGTVLRRQQPRVVCMYV